VFIVTIKTKGEEKPILELKTEDRARSRSVALLCQENKLECMVTQELAPRVVKFKGL